MTRINEVLYFVLYDLCKIKKKPTLMAQKDGTGRKKREMCDGRIHL